MMVSSKRNKQRTLVSQSELFRTPIAGAVDESSYTNGVV